MSEPARNDVTGDEIKSKINSNKKNFDNNFDQIDWSVKLEPEQPKKDKDES